MNYQIIELCSADSKNYQQIVSANESYGNVVYKVNNKYYTVIYIDLVWKAASVVFKPVNSGLYVFKE